MVFLHIESILLRISNFIKLDCCIFNGRAVNQDYFMKYFFSNSPHCFVMQPIQNPLLCISTLGTYLFVIFTTVLFLHLA